MQCEFEQVTTVDGIDLQGLVFTPPRHSSGQAGDTVGVWIHGFGSSFHTNQNRIVILAQVFKEHGLAFATFDTRGHDVVTPARTDDERKKKGYRGTTVGAAYEQFHKSDIDIHAIVLFLKKKFKRVVLIGHSTGANKVVYYTTRIRFRKEAHGVVLVAPVSDVPGWQKGLEKNYQKAIDYARDMIANGKKNELMPIELIGQLLTAQRFLSLASQESDEQMFPTRTFRGPLWRFSTIKLPLLVVMGEHDQYLDYPVENHIERFTTENTSRKFQATVIPGADHSFDGKEKELAEVITQWIKNLTVLP